MRFAAVLLPPFIALLSCSAPTPPLAPVAAPPSLAQPVDPPVPQTVRKEKPAPTTLAEAELALGEALRNLAAVEASTRDHTSTGWIRGRLVDRDGNPISGTRIHAQSQQRGDQRPSDPAQWLGRSAVGTDLGAQLAWMVELSLNAIRASRSSITDTDGVFTIEGLGHGKYKLAAFDEQAIMDTVTHATGSTVELVGTRIVHHELDVRLPDGMQPPEAVVNIVGGRDLSTSWRWTPEHPSFPSRRSSVSVSVAAGDLDWLAQDWIGRYRADPLALDSKSEETARVNLVASTQLRLTIHEDNPIAQGLAIKGLLVQSSTGREIELKPLGPNQLGAIGIDPDSYELLIWRGGGEAEIEESLTINSGWNELTVDPESFLTYFDPIPDNITLTLESPSLGMLHAKVPANMRPFEVVVTVTGALVDGLRLSLERRQDDGN